MNVDVTNTQTGGNEPVSKAEDFKANITPAKQEESAQTEIPTQAEPAVPVAQIIPVENTEVKPIEPPVFPIGKMEGPVYTEIPDPIDMHSFQGIDLSSFGEYDATEHISENTNEIKPQEQLEEDNSDVIKSDAIGYFQPESKEGESIPTSIDAIIPVDSKPITEPITEPKTETITETITEPITEPKTQQVGIHTIGDIEFNGITTDGKPTKGTATLNDGTIATGEFDSEGQLHKVGSIQKTDGTGYVGNVKDGKANGIGVVTDKNGVEKTVTIKDGVIQNEIATSKPKGSEPTEIKAAFKPKDYSTIYATEDKQKEDVAPEKAIDKGNRTFQAMQAITDKEIYDAAKGTVEFIDEKKEAERVNVKAVVRGINEVVTPEVQQRIRNGGILTNEEKLKLQEVLKGFDNSKLQKQAKENEAKGNFGAKMLLGNAHPLAGDYSNFLGTNTKTLLKTIYAINKEGKQMLAELDKPQPVQPKTVGEQVEANLTNKAKNVIKGSEAQYNRYTGEMGNVTYDAKYSAKVKGVVDYIMSPKYNDFIKAELTTGDRVVNDKKLDLMLRGGNPKGNYIVDENTRKDILELHQDAIEIQLSKVAKSKNQYGLVKAQEIIAIDNKNLEEKKTDLLTDVTGNTLPFYTNKKVEQEKKMKETYESELANIQSSAKESYNTSIKSLSESNPQIKSLYQEYNEKMMSASAEQRESLSTELKGKLSAIPEYKELNKAYTDHLKTETDNLNKQTELAQISMAASLRDECIRDLQKNYTTGLKKLERQSGYLAQYNVYNSTDALQESTSYKKADYQTKKVMTENLWNKHVRDATEFFAGTGVPTPKNEEERLNKHFTEWTGPLRAKTSEDMAVYSHLISKVAHDKFRVYSNYDAISDEKGNVFQYKAILEDSKAEIVANMKYLETTLGKDAYHNERYAKWKHQLEVVQDGIDRPENEQNTLSSFVKGFAEADIPFIGGIIRSYDADRLSQAAKNYSNGTASRADAGLLLTKTVKGTLDNFTPTSFIHGLGTGVGQTVSIATELAFIEGAGNLTFKATGEILGKLAAESAATTAKIGITEAVLEAGKVGLINPETVKFTQQVINIASRGSNGLARIFLTAAAQPGTGAAIEERKQQNVNETMVVLHAGGMDDAIAQMEKGHEGELEAVFKSVGGSLISTGAELTGGLIFKQIDNVVGKKIMDYMSSNQFFKRNVVGAFMRKKGFTTADELTNYVNKIKEAGKIGEFHHEMAETYIEVTGTNIVEGNDWAKGYGDGQQAATVLFTSALFGGVKGGINVTKKIVVKSNPAATHVYFDMEDGEKTSTSVSTEAWNYFNNQVGKENFNSNAFLDFAEKAKLTLPQKTALAQIYMKVNPNAHNDIKNIQANVEKMTGEKVTEEQIQGGTVEVVNQEFESKETTTEPTTTEPELTLREKEEQVKISEERDAKIQSKIDEEIEYIKKNIETNEGEFYKKKLELLENNPIEYFKRSAENLISSSFSDDTKQFYDKHQREAVDILAALKEQQKEKQAKTETNDNQNQAGIPSEVGTTEESIQGQPIQETGSQATEASGVVQEPSKEVSGKTVEDIENERDLAINELSTKFQRVDTDNEEQASLEREKRQPEYAKELDKLNAEYDAKIESLKTNESTTPTNTPTDGNVQPTAEPSVQTTEVETVQSTTEPTASKKFVDLEQIGKNTHYDKVSNNWIEKKGSKWLVKQETTGEVYHEAKSLKDAIAWQESENKIVFGLDYFNTDKAQVDDTPTKVTETKTVLSDDTKVQERKEQREAKELEALPLLEVTEDNPFHAERQAGKNAIKKQKFRKQYQSEINEIKEINDNFESIVEQLNLKTKDC